MQTLDVKIPIPDTHVIIPKEVYEDLRDQELTGQYYTLKDLSNLTGKSRTWLYENLLDNPHRMDQMKEFTHFPQGSGDKWLFKATELRKFLESNFLNILRRD